MLIAMADANQIDLLLIGKTGNGKSATGNSILRRKAFKSRSSTSSVTLNVDYEVSEFRGRKIKVVDGPGVGDNRMNSEHSVNLIIRTMEHAIAMNPRGYHAFLLLSRYGGRFTEEDQETIDFLKKIFGQDFVKNFCILVLTCGDNFEHDCGNSEKSFQKWCNEEKGKFRDLLRECDNRAVLFDNITRNQEKKNRQIENLLRVVDNLSSRGQRYNDTNFEQAREARNRIIVDLKKPMIQEKTMTETSLILLKLQELQAIEDLMSRVDPLERLLISVESLATSVSSQDQGTGELHDLTATVKSIKKLASDEIKFCYKMKDERENSRRREEELKRNYEWKMRMLKEQSDRRIQEGARVLEESRNLEKEQKRLAREMEEANKRDREEIERKYSLENARIKRQKRELKTLYNKMKEENAQSIIGDICDRVTFPLRQAYSSLFSTHK